MNVIHMRDKTLNDIPGQLRALADRIENGEVAKPERCVAILDSDNYITCFGWGDLPNTYAAVGLIQAAVVVLVRSEVVCE